MKILLALLSVALIGVSAQAQIAHNLTIYSADGLKFFLTINGELKNAEAKSNVTIENIEFDFVNATLTFEGDTHPPIKKKSLKVGDEGVPTAIVYQLVMKKDGLVLKYDGKSPKKIQPINIQQTAPPPAEENGIKIKTGGVQIQIKD